MTLLKDIQRSVERLYVKGRPLHHLESARTVQYDPTSTNVSSIFVVWANLFKDLSPEDIQNILRYRHILVLGVEVEEMYFDLAGLSSLGSLTRPRSIQGESL